MADVLNWIWQGCAIAAVTGSALACMRRSSARHRYLLCWIAQAAVLLVPVLAVLWPDSPAAAAPPASSEPVAPGLSIPSAWWTSSAAVAGLWTAWVTLYVFRITNALRTVQRLKARCAAVPRAIESRLRHWTVVKRQGRATRLVVSPRLPSAAVLGCGRPVIALSPSLVRGLPPDELDRVVVHEWAHVQRRDDVLNALQLAVRALAGWHPAVWWLDRQMRIEREAACDEIAVAITGSAKAYANCLMALARVTAESRPPLAALGASTGALRVRVARILSIRSRTSGWRSPAAVAAAAAVLAVFACGIGRVPLVAAALPPAQPLDPAPVHVESVAVAATGRPALEPGVRRTDAGAPAPAPVRRPRASSSTRQSAPPERPIAAPAAPTPDMIPADRPLTADTGPLPELVAAAPGLARDVAPAPDVRPVPPWRQAADAGVAVGRGSQAAAVATAGFFTRVGKKIAGSF